ncbi:hypothetical protein [Spirochaeta cellobiosiphila]|uniref:hypothetical protein n=1 Tax=Spirochaeta cellobiosiphila TaxID=504483 RepID=UPI00048C0C42|nr:hypothetical protein [Spirochaeta cellobiosiphila]
MDYNIDLLAIGNKRDQEKLIFQEASLWKTWIKDQENETGETPQPWFNYYTPLALNIEKNYILFDNFGPTVELSTLIKKTTLDKHYLYLKITEVSDLNKYYRQPGYEALYNHPTPYNLIFVQDGDYLDMYIDSVSEENHIFTYVRGTKKMAQEIEHFVRRESYDPSKILWPRHADGSSDYDDQIELIHTTDNSYLALTKMSGYDKKLKSIRTS